MKHFIAKKPEPYDKRIVRKFLFVKRTFGRDSRWLEFADIEERYMGVAWEEVDFIDNRTAKIEKIEAETRRQSFLVKQYEKIVDDTANTLCSSHTEEYILSQCLNQIIAELAKGTKV